VAAQNRVLLAEHQQFSILRQVLTEYQDDQAEQPANQQVDDLE
jgi:siderophore synthetase component